LESGVVKVRDSSATKLVAAATCSVAERINSVGVRVIVLFWLFGSVLIGLTQGATAQAPAATSPSANNGDRVVWLVDFDGPLGPAMADLIGRSIDDAADAGAEALIIRMDTPGGLDKSMRVLIQKILAAPVPVITYVAPQGARAASAGTYIAYASHVAVMSPATNIGSSTPVSLAPEPKFPSRPRPPLPGSAPEAGGDPAATGPERESDSDSPAARPAFAEPSTGSDAMARKVINDSVAYLQGLAELRGRNIDWAEATVREGANLRSSQALALGVIDLISRDLEQLLQDLDGREVSLAAGSVTLRTADARVQQVESDWKHDLLEIITDPTIAYALLIFGVYGLILEFYSPGMVFPSVIGIVCLLLGAYGLQMLPVNYAGLLLIVVGIGLMVAELITPTMGILGVAGLAAFVFGSVILIDTQSPGYSLPLSVIAAFTVATGGLVVLTIGVAMRARNQRVVSGVESMVGGPATALESFDGIGRVQAFGEIWQARCAQPVVKGELLDVVAVEGLTLEVVRSQSAAG
jgi:membrane-bound serine protease (ClpP class)